MKKVFISAGELSGDKLASWFVKKLKSNNSNIYFEAIGGKSLEAENVKLYDNIKNFNVTGVWEVVQHLPLIFQRLKTIINYLIKEKFDEVILVDFPGFNLLLAKHLKKKFPNLKITYLSPPQLWIWGEWRARAIQKNCDEVIVIYPFEVEWYKKRGIEAKWLGYPFYEELKPYFEQSKNKKNQIALLPGSRESEIKTLVPIICEIVLRFKSIYSEVKFVLPLAESISLSSADKAFKEAGFENWQNYIKPIFKEDEKLEALSQSAFAISKPGTVTLQLALLQVPTIIIYKVSWITYCLGKMAVSVRFMGLPNLFLKEEIFPELLQEKCSSEFIFKAAFNLYEMFLLQNQSYLNIQNKLSSLRELLKN